MKDAAVELHEEARSALRDQDYGACYAKSRAAWSVHHHPQIAAVRADCAERVGEFVDAAVFATAAIKAFPNGPIYERMQSVLAEARKNVAVVTVDPEPADASVTVDGDAVDPSEMFLKPGEHVIRATAPGFEQAEEIVTVTAGQTLTATVVLPKIGVGTDPSPVEPSSPGNEGLHPGWPIATGVLTAVALGVGIGTAVGASSADDEAGDLQAAVDATGATGATACGPGSPLAANTCTELADAIDESRTLSGVAIGSLVAAGVLGATTVTLAVLAANGEEPSGDEADVTLAPFVDLQHVGLIFRAVF